MLVLLPPSEGKTAPGSGPRLDLGALSFPGLTAARKRVQSALVSLCRSDAAAAARVLDLGPTLHDVVRANAAIRTAACGEAITVYTGVLYEALDVATLARPARRRLDTSVAVASALFGLLQPTDLIPAYRLSADTIIPNLGALRSVWSTPVGAALEATSGPILDLRSTAYAGLAPVPPTIAHRALVGRVLLDRHGRRSVVSHHNKATKGRLVRGLVAAGPLPRSVNGLLESISALGYGVELHEPADVRRPARLDIVVTET